MYRCANLSIGVNVVYEGSPSRILKVLLISLGITTHPKSSILQTIPISFIIYNNLLALQICTVGICKTRSYMFLIYGLFIVKLSPNAPIDKIRSIINGAV